MLYEANCNTDYAPLQQTVGDLTVGATYVVKFEAIGGLGGGFDDGTGSGSWWVTEATGTPTDTFALPCGAHYGKYAGEQPGGCTGGDCATGQRRRRVPGGAAHLRGRRL